jgi:hypothetical protein
MEKLEAKTEEFAGKTVLRCKGWCHDYEMRCKGWCHDRSETAYKELPNAESFN